jgi:16S rRNA (guanine527-N7)-methyltransferase
LNPKNNLPKRFINALETNQTAFSISLSAEKTNELARYYELVENNNPILHLVAPDSPETFAVRHVLESLFLQKFLPADANFADIGTGAGLPSIPCLILREDLRGVLIESKLKKARFLEEVLRECKLEKRAKVFDRQFEEVQKPVDVNFVTCRALDKFSEKLPKILKWSKKSDLLLFGGNNLGEQLNKHSLKFEQKLIPQSERRFLFIAQNRISSV